MIFKASRISTPQHVGKLAAHLVRLDENEHVGAVEFRGLSERAQLSSALRSMFRTRELTRAHLGLFHVAINPREDESAVMTADQWRTALAELEQRFNLTEQPRVMVSHVKGGRLHLHAVYQVADVERGRKCHSFAHDFAVCRDLGAELEQRFQQERTPRERTGQGYTRDQWQQAKREGMTVPERRRALRDAWKASRDGAEFRERVRALGFELAAGDKAALVLLGLTGSPVALGPELRGTAKVRDVHQRMKGLTFEPVAQVKKRQRDQARGRGIETRPVRPAPQEPERIRTDRTGRSLEDAIAAAQRVQERRAAERAQQMAEAARVQAARSATLQRLRDEAKGMTVQPMPEPAPAQEPEGPKRLMPPLPPPSPPVQRHPVSPQRPGVNEQDQRDAKRAAWRERLGGNSPPRPRGREIE